MEKALQITRGKEVFNKMRIFGQVYEFLTTADLVLLASVCQASKSAVNLVFRDKLMAEGSQVKPEVTDNLRLYKEIHLKSVIILPLSALDCKDKIDVFAGAKITKKTLFIDRIVKDFSFGIKFVAYYFEDKDLTLITKVDYLSMDKYTLSNSNNNRKIKSVESFSVDARQLTYLNSEKTLKVIYYLKGKSIHSMPEITISENVVTFQANYNFMAYQTKSSDFYLYSKYSDMNLGQSVKYRLSMPSSDYTMHLSGLTFYIRDDRSCSHYSLALNAIDGIVVEGDRDVKHVMPVQWSSPSSKPITGMFTGLRNEIIVCEDQYRNTEDWNNEEVREWFKSIGVYTIDNILKYDKFTGDQLNQIDRQMMVDRFGIKNTDVHNKILSEIELEQDKTNYKPDLFGIGCNSDGQLGVNNGQKNVSKWEKLKYPTLSNTDSIKDIQFGWNNSLILTKEGRMFLSYKKQRKRPEEDLMEEEMLKLTTKNSNFGGKKTNRKQSEAATNLANYSSNEGVENVAPSRRKRGSKKGEEMYISDEESHDSVDTNENRGGKKNKIKKKATTNKQGRGIKKEKRKYSFQPSDLKKDDDEGVAKWVEITNLFRINKYS